MRGLIGPQDPDLATRVHARLDLRLESHVPHPVAIALSGGGDSMALLQLVAQWAERNGRGLVAITVDHGLNADSPRWNALCETAARKVGARWHLCRWQGDKPASGLPAAARAARHALIADVARGTGARVILFAHTADDIVESDWMRAQGSTLGQLREWAPSPAWPEGRGLMLMRPMLKERRETLRDGLVAGGTVWIEDPANTDDRFARSRARHALATRSLLETPEPVDPGPGPGQAPEKPCPQRSVRPLPLGAGFILQRSTDAADLAATLLCAAGTRTPPRGDRLTALLARIRKDETFTATLAGARVMARNATVVIGREPGRHAIPEMVLPQDRPVVWDGRFEITVLRAGYSVGPASGRLKALSKADQQVLQAVPANLRPTLPVLIRDDGSTPVLAWRDATVKVLGPRRLSLALGETTQECHLHATIHGETPPTDLFSKQELHQGGPHQPPTNRETR